MTPADILFLLIFLIGFGVGGLATFTFVGWCFRGGSQKQRDFNAELLELWHERNQLHREEIEAIRNNKS
jgi:hypothetical protein